jgi:hypothetical protein
VVDAARGLPVQAAAGIVAPFRNRAVHTRGFGLFGLIVDAETLALVGAHIDLPDTPVTPRAGFGEQS